MNFRISPKDGVCSWIIHSSIFQTAGPMWVQHDIIQVYFLNWLLNGFIKVYTCWFPWQRSKYFFCITTGAASLLHSKWLFNSKHKLFESSSPSSALSVQIRSLFFIQSFKLEYISGPMLHSHAIGIIVNTNFLVGNWTWTALERPYMANFRLGNSYLR